MDPESLMQHAIQAAEHGIRDQQSPFGCAIARDDQLIAACHNLVWRNTDITAHAEITAIQEACRQVGQVWLSDCVVATTCEPCPMCMAALHWARVPRVFYGATIADAAEAGFNELNVEAATLLRIGNSQVQLRGGVLPERCKALFALWQQASGRTY